MLLLGSYCCTTKIASWPYVQPPQSRWWWWWWPMVILLLLLLLLMLLLFSRSSGLPKTISQGTMRGRRRRGRQKKRRWVESGKHQRVDRAGIRPVPSPRLWRTGKDGESMGAKSSVVPAPTIRTGYAYRKMKWGRMQFDILLDQEEGNLLFCLTKKKAIWYFTWPRRRQFDILLDQEEGNLIFCLTKKKVIWYFAWPRRRQFDILLDHQVHLQW